MVFKKFLFLIFFTLLVFSLSADKFFAGDKIVISIWHNTDLSGEYEIDKEGNITLPLIGVIHIEGMEKDSLVTVIKNKLKDYLKEPYLEVTPLHKVTVLGEVYKPSVLYVSENAKVSDVIAMVGGNRENANLGWIYIKNSRLGNRFVNIYSTKPLKSGDIIVISRNIWPSWGELSIFLSVVSISLSLYNSFLNR